MSFSFSFNAKTPRIAVERLNNMEYVPAVVKALIVQALQGCDDQKPVRVVASGHIPEFVDKVSSQYSTITLQVEPLSFIE